MSTVEKLGRRLLAIVGISALTAACAPDYLDPIARGNPSDPCLALDADSCVKDTAHGCSLQPNPVGCTSDDPRCGEGTCAGGDAFVRRVGETLFLKGEPFTFVGTVSWQLAWNDGGCNVSGYQSQADALGPVFDELARMRLSVLRFWAFQSYAGASGKDYSHFDRLVARARSAGVRLIPVLENMHPDCSSGDMKDDAWFDSGYRQPYGNYALSYRDYVAGLVAHFRAEPTIIAWELMHEAGGDEFDVLDSFAIDMTALIRGAAPNHLLSFGLDNGATPATSLSGSPSSYARLQDHAEIDLVDVHDFGDSSPFPVHLAQSRAIAQAMGKPIFAGATAATLNNVSAASFSTRANTIEEKLDAAFANDFRGFLVYDYVPSWSSPTFDFDSRSSEPLAGPDGLLARSARP